MAFFSSLFNINSAKLHPDYPKHIDTYKTNTETEDDYNEYIDECGEDNTNSSCYARVENENIETPNFLLKIKFIFQILCDTIYRGKMKTPLHINSSAIYVKSKSRELLTCFNRLGLCMSYKETKQLKKHLAKLAIFNSESHGIPLPTHFSPTQFTLAAMDNFDHFDANSLVRISAAHDTETTLFQINPTTNIRKPLKSKVTLKGISSISFPCKDIAELYYQY